MGDASTISWLARPGTRPATWNPIRARNVATGKVGWHCEPVHDGCAGCYAEAQNAAGFRGGTGLAYKPGHRQNGDVEIFLDEKTLLQPLGWTAPRTIFVCSMTDLYGSWVPDAWLDRIKAVEAATPQHTWIELTKRPERMLAYLADRAWYARAAYRLAGLAGASPGAWRTAGLLTRLQAAGEPLANVWGGASCSTQRDADRFLPIVLATPLAIRIASLEPLLGPIEASRHLGGLAGCPGIDWAIIGGESGSGARESILDDHRSLIGQCRAAGTAVFEKQLGRFPVENGGRLKLRDRKGEDPAEWPEDLRVRGWPESPTAARRAAETMEARP